MWTREMLKTNAKSVLKRSYGSALVVSLILSVLSGGTSSVSGPRIDFDNYTNPFTSGDIDFSRFLPVIGVAFFIALIIGLAITIFFTNVLSVGSCRFYMESREKKSEISQLFYAFKSGQYLNIVATMFVTNLIIIAGTIFFIIPGIIFSYMFRMVPYILSENPGISLGRALSLSKQMTDGEKLNILVLDLSFIGWMLLGMLACCIGVLFLQPYIEATNAELYALLRAKSFSMGFSNQSELPGFSPFSSGYNQNYPNQNQNNNEPPYGV